MRNKIALGVFFLFTLFPIYPGGKEEKQDMGTKEDKIVKLPKPNLKGAMSLEECIQNRRSKRSFSSQPLSLEQVSQLLWAAQGITDQKRGLRAAPSAGALYPLELYVVKSDGVYHYKPEEHELERLGSEDLRKPLAGAAHGQESVSEAPMDIVICAVYERVTGRYGNRGIMYTHIEVGHAAQNIHLEAVALGLGSVPIGAFQEEKASGVLALPKDQKPLYIIPVGYEAK